MEQNSIISQLEAWTHNPSLKRWIQQMYDLCQPSQLYLCRGGKREYERMIREMVTCGMAIPLSSKKRPNSFLFRSDPSDVARVESRTFICSEREEEAGPTNHWKSPVQMKEKLKQLFSGCMKGRTMYVIPFCMGPLNSSLSQFGVEITDSPYVVSHMHLMTRVHEQVLSCIEQRGHFILCAHSVGVPLDSGQPFSGWPSNAKEKYITHFPKTKEIWSYGSGYGGNALLGKKCLALRIASVMAREEGWLAEHMAVIAITNPEGKKKYFAAAFPSACGKTNFAMMTPSLSDWKIECVGDDIVWMKFDHEGILRGINPEAGFFGVAPGTSFHSNPAAMQMLSQNTLFTNVALTGDRDVWWEGMETVPQNPVIDWLGREWQAESGERAAHPNSRFTVSATQCPIIDAKWESAFGIPISAILFGGRRSNTQPLVSEAFSWQHGIFWGASLSSERTAAAEGTRGELRHDPFAMLPFCGYHMGDYFAHWLRLGQSVSENNLPKIFSVNWFRRDEKNEFLWPGFGENVRILEWIFARTEGREKGIESPIGYLPCKQSLNLRGLTLSPKQIDQLLHVESKEWKRECDRVESYFQKFGARLPKALWEELTQLRKRLSCPEKSESTRVG